MEGRFISKDPIDFDGGINLYACGDNDPIIYIDPLGLAAGVISYGGNSVPYSTGPSGQMVITPVRSGVVDGYNAAIKEMSYWAGKASTATIGAIVAVGTKSKKLGVFAYEWADY